MPEEENQKGESILIPLALILILLFFIGVYVFFLGDEKAIVDGEIQVIKDKSGQRGTFEVIIMSLSFILFLFLIATKWKHISGLKFFEKGKVEPNDKEQPEIENKPHPYLPSNFKFFLLVIVVIIFGVGYISNIITTDPYFKDSRYLSNLILIVGGLIIMIIILLFPDRGLDEEETQMWNPLNAIYLICDKRGSSPLHNPPTYWDDPDHPDTAIRTEFLVKDSNNITTVVIPLDCATPQELLNRFRPTTQVPCRTIYETTTDALTERNNNTQLSRNDKSPEKPGEDKLITKINEMEKEINELKNK